MRCSRSLAVSAMLFLTLVMFCGIPALSQDPANVAMGVNPQATYHSGDFDFIDTTTGRLSLRIPLVIDHSQRGKLNFTYSVSFSSTGAWQAVISGVRGQFHNIQPPKYGLSGPAVVAEGSLSGQIRQRVYDDFTGNWYTAWWVTEDGYGVGPIHPMGTTSGGMESIDGSGIVSAAFASSATNKEGIQFQWGSTAAETDANGNKITTLGPTYYPGGLSVSTMTDTLGRTWTTNAYASGGDVTGCPTGGPVAPTTSTIWTIPGPANTVRTFKFCYSTYNVHTNFNYMGYNEYVANLGPLTGVVLPDGTTWRFDYDNSSINYGDLIAVYPPTGGHISYTWTTTGGVCSDYGPGIRTVTSRTVSDGTNSSTWTYNWANGGGTVTDPLNNDTVYTGGATCNGFVTQIQSYSGSAATGTLLKTVNKTYRSLPNPYLVDMGSNGPAPQLLSGVTTVWPNGQQSQVQMTYDSGFTFNDTNLNFPPPNNPYTSSYGLVTSESHSDYNNGSPGPVLSTTNTNYLALSNSSYVTANILDLPSSQIILNGSGNKCAETDYGYDDPARLVSSGVTMQHVAAPSSVRGIVTSVTRQLYTNPCQSANPTGTPVTSYLNVYDTGMLQKSLDPLNNPTTYSYSGTYYGAYPTTVTNALNQSMTYTYDFNTGLMASMTDPNNQQTTYSWDNMLRLTQANFPDGGQQTFTPINSGGYFTGGSLSKKITSSQNFVTTQLFDGLGRLKETQLNSDPAGTDYTDIAYDAVGRKSKVWNPTRCNPAQTNCGESTWGFTTYNYDPLNRVTSVAEQDNSTVSTDYSSFPCTTVTDEATKKRKSCVDGAGRMTGVWEDPNGLNYQTSYTYDALDNLLSVTQSGSRQRTFGYDSLSRLTSASNPESGATSYTYDANGNVLTKTDARGVVANHSPSGYPIDALNRVTSVTYSDGTPTAYFFYDQTSIPPYSLSNPIGRLTTEGTYLSGLWQGATNFSYDAMGRVSFTLQDTPQDWELVTSSTYDLAGDLSSLTYPSGRKVTYQYNNSMQPTQVRFDSFNGTSVGYNYLSSATYAPTGAPASLTLGSGVIESASYNNRLQPCNLQAATGTFTWLNRTNNFYPTPGVNCQPGTGGNNGNVISIADNLQSNRTQSFGYDTLNRITSAQTQGTSGADCWAQSFGYDAWANLLSATPTRPGCPMTQLSLGVNANNRITNPGFSYDAAGNLLADGSSSYAYDGESRIKTLNTTGAAYTYDGNGQRVYKQVGSDTTEYVYFNGQPIAERKANGDWSDYIYLGGRRLARNNTYAHRIVTSGTRCGSCAPPKWDYF